MANTIDQAFIKQFETDVHLAYQRMGSKLRNTIRSTNVSGNVARFQKIGTGTASTKSRNGNVTPMELAHTNVEVTMADFYAAEYIDKLDELKTNINERQAIAESAAAALGRSSFSPWQASHVHPSLLSPRQLQPFAGTLLSRRIGVGSISKCCVAPNAPPD